MATKNMMWDHQHVGNSTRNTKYLVLTVQSWDRWVIMFYSVYLIQYAALYYLMKQKPKHNCIFVIYFPLLKACRISGSISYAHITCWSPNSWAFLTPHLLQILLRRLYHLTELNRTGESIQARSFVEDNCHQNQSIKKLQHSPAHLSVASWMLLTFAVRFWRFFLHLSPSSLRSASQPLIWH